MLWFISLGGRNSAFPCLCEWKCVWRKGKGEHITGLHGLGSHRSVKVKTWYILYSEGEAKCGKWEVEALLFGLSRPNICILSRACVGWFCTCSYQQHRECLTLGDARILELIEPMFFSDLSTHSSAAGVHLIQERCSANLWPWHSPVPQPSPPPSQSSLLPVFVACLEEPNLTLCHQPG